jgi:hypothetical protein
VLLQKLQRNKAFLKLFPGGTNVIAERYMRCKMAVKQNWSYRSHHLGIFWADYAWMALASFSPVDCGLRQADTWS